MAGVNKVIVVGNLGRDPELRYTAGGNPVTTLSVATTRAYTNKNNDRVEETEWHRVVVWGKSAEHCNNYLSVGRQVYVEGRLQTRSYTHNGEKRYSTEIVAESVQFLGSGKGNGQSSEGRGSNGKNAAAGNVDIPDPTDDDIPF